MNMQNQEFRSATQVVIVAPIWLQNVLSLWLQAYEKVEVVICTATRPASSLPLSLMPDLVILSADHLATPLLVQVEEVKALWPTTTLLVLSNTEQAELQAAGAEMVLCQDFSPGQLLEAIKQLECLTTAVN